MRNRINSSERPDGPRSEIASSFCVFRQRFRLAELFRKRSPIGRVIAGTIAGTIGRGMDAIPSVLHTRPIRPRGGNCGSGKPCREESQQAVALLRVVPLPGGRAQLLRLLASELWAIQSSTGEATKIELYVPTTTPITRENANTRMACPPKA